MRLIRTTLLSLLALVAFTACSSDTPSTPVAEPSLGIGPTYEDTIAWRKAWEAGQVKLDVSGINLYPVHSGVPDCSAQTTNIAEFYTDTPAYVGADILPGEDWLNRIERGEIYSYDAVYPNSFCRNWYLGISFSVNTFQDPEMLVDYQPDRQTMVVKHGTGNSPSCSGLGQDRAQLYGAVSQHSDTSHWCVSGF